MADKRFSQLSLRTPYYLIEQEKIADNCRILAEIRERTGCRILLALKGFSMYSLFPLISHFLDGVSASGLHEARLGYEEFGGEVHTFSPAYREDEFAEIFNYSGHIIFNSWYQWQKFKSAVAGRQIGLRINPGYSEVKTDLYNPCAPGSRLGMLPEELKGKDLTGVNGLHFHALCEQGAETLERVLGHVEKKFGHLFSQIDWLNFGGGHQITRADYDRDLLCKLIDRFQYRHKLQVYLEPGEAIALNAGVLISSVLDIVKNADTVTAILDTSAEAHMPDVLAMPYRPEVVGAGKPGELPHTYRLAGNTCLAGDIIGDYSFPAPLIQGQRLIFQDMAHYTMVKNTTFNGINLPSIAIYDAVTDSVEVVKEFGYQDFRTRLS